MYPAEITAPMAAELTEAGFTHLHTVEDVDNTLRNQEGTTLVVVNSVCGCAAGAARPGVVHAIQNTEKNPSNIVTVFAGVDLDATKRVREYLLPYPPSSPAIALFKDGDLVHMIERHHIEGRPAFMISANLQAAFEEFC
ncbi:MAG: BrxA/BrxB family bacilliredoxin [Bacteroidota bacterium]